MSENVVYVITENDSGMFLNAEHKIIQLDMNFQCFFPSNEEATNFRQRVLSDRRGRYFSIREVEIVEFLNNQLTVAYEGNMQEEVSPF